MSGLRQSFGRIGAVLYKEVVQMRRDRITFAMMLGVPLMQLLLFGYAINTDPRNLPAAVQVRDPSEFSRAVEAGMRNSRFFELEESVVGEAAGDRALRGDSADFVLVIPEDFEERLVRGERPQLMLEADAADPVAVAGPTAAMQAIVDSALSPLLTGPLETLAPRAPPYELIVHRRFNPEGITAHNVVPGLLGVILTMTLVMITSMAITREAERGTMETLLSTPARPIEVMIGKIMPYVAIGYVQTAVILTAAVVLFDVPIQGSLLLLLFAVTLFILVNLSLGFLISTAARNQMQAMQLTFFLFLPSILLSGFMFPFRGMPDWAQAIGQILPLTHFLRLVRGIVLRDAELMEMVGDIWPLLVQLFVIGTLAMLRYRRTLD
jgi:ABC-2 type transport system permease protein